LSRNAYSQGGYNKGDRKKKKHRGEEKRRRKVALPLAVADVIGIEGKYRKGPGGGKGLQGKGGDGIFRKNCSICSKGGGRNGRDYMKIGRNPLGRQQLVLEKKLVNDRNREKRRKGGTEYISKTYKSRLGVSTGPRPLT